MPASALAVQVAALSAQDRQGVAAADRADARPLPQVAVEGWWSLDDVDLFEMYEPMHVHTPGAQPRGTIIQYIV